MAWESSSSGLAEPSLADLAPYSSVGRLDAGPANERLPSRTTGTAIDCWCDA